MLTGGQGMLATLRASRLVASLSFYCWSVHNGPRFLELCNGNGLI